MSTYTFKNHVVFANAIINKGLVCEEKREQIAAPSP